MPFDAVHRLIDGLGELPGVRQLRRRRHEQRFRRCTGHAFSGVYDSFEAARAAVPPGLPDSYDTAAAAGMYVDRLSVDEHDYPALFWLQRSLVDGWRSVCDLGGSVGIKYYAFAPLLGAAAELRWHVVEVPAAAALGARLAAEKGADPLTFGTDFADASGRSVLLASGALQYLPLSLGQILAALPVRPQRLIVNTTPIHAARSFFTLNSIGTACCPYRVASRGGFVAEVEAQGYRLRDEWRNAGKRLLLPFERGLSLDAYSGFCFERS